MVISLRRPRSCGLAPSTVPEPYDGTMPRTDSASSLVAAPPERVFDAFVDLDALTAWLPPDGMHGSFERFDARPGGSYRMILTYDDASTAPGKAKAASDIVEARFVDIVPGVRVVQAVDFVSDDPAYAGTMTMTWEVTAVDAGTRVDIRADDVPDGISRTIMLPDSAPPWQSSAHTWSSNQSTAPNRSCSASRASIPNAEPPSLQCPASGARERRKRSRVPHAAAEPCWPRRPGKSARRQRCSCRTQSRTLATVLRAAAQPQHAAGPGA